MDINPDDGFDFPRRSPTVAVNTVSNSRGHFVNVFIDGVPSETLGPFEERLTLPQALVLVATHMRMNDAQGANVS